MDQPTVLVTGDAGLLGRTLWQRQQGRWQLRGLDKLRGEDLADTALLKRSCQGVDTVVHIAALHAPHVGKVSAAEFRRVNVEGTARLLDAALTARVRRFVLASSTSVYGSALERPGQAVWVTEALSPQPRDIYDETKIAAESLVSAAAPDFRQGTLTLRIGRCFKEPAADRARFRLYRGLHPTDTARAFALAAEKSVSGTLLLSARTPFTLDDRVQLWDDPNTVLAARAPHVAAVLAKRGWSFTQPVDRVYDASLAALRLGWETRVDWLRATTAHQ
jgi:UDP-glucose 4-epimerase